MLTRNGFYLLLLSLCLTFSGCQSFSLNTGGETTSNLRPLIERCPQNAADEVVARSINVSPARLAALKTYRSLANNDICTMPDAALQRAFARLDKPKADHPGEWAEFRNMQRRSEDGKVKAEGLIKALEHRKNMLRKPGGPGTAAGTGTGFAGSAAAGTTATADPTVPGSASTLSAGISGNQWASLGPGNVGGRIRAILVDPTNADRIWVGSVSGGIWTSTDGGASWSPCNDFMGNLSVSSLVMDPRDHNVIYAGTGEGAYNGDAVRGAGVFKSTDGGVTWNQLPATTPSSNISSEDYNWFYVNRLAMAGDGSAILAATRGYYANVGAIYRSTDGGASWSIVSNLGRVSDVRFDPNDPRKAVANVIRYASGTYYSDIMYSVDGGQSWITGGTFVGSIRIELAYAKSNSQIVYASKDYSSGQILKSTDGGASWTTVSNPQHLGSQGWYDNTIWVDPTNASHLVIGGLDLWRSTNGGVSWTKISNWVNNMYNGYRQVPHADHHVLVSDPNYDGTTNRRLYNANDGGVFRSPDISLATETSGWENLNNGLAITQFYSGAGHTSAGGRIIGGTQDNGSQVKSPTANDWQLAYGGDGGFSAVDSQDDNYFYGEYVYLQLHRATNGAASSYIYSGITDAGQSANANFIAPFILDPNDNNRLLAGGASLWQSLAVKASSPSWSAIKASIGSNISAIAVANGISSTVWVGHNNGKIYQSSNSLAASPKWTQVSTTKTPARMVNRIMIDPDDPNRVYAAFGGYNADNLYVTADNGSTWTNITGNLPSVPIFTIVRHRTNSNWLYVGTEVGLFTSQDGGTTWQTTNDGPANVEISELSWLDDSTLLAATHGRGIFKTTVVMPDTTPPTVTAISPAAGAAEVSITAPITATFSESVDANTITFANFTVDHGATGTVTYDDTTRTATFAPSGSLAYSTTYTATITTAVKDVAGNAMSQAMTWTFTTAAAPSPVRLLAPAATGYQTLQSAYDNATSGNTIEAQAMSFAESLVLAKDIAVLLQGGYDTAFTTNSGGYSTTGSLTVSNGTVTIDSFRFR